MKRSIFARRNRNNHQQEIQMFPNPSNRPYRPKRPSPASGNPLYPNGTYVSPPSNAVYGMQGQYGAMLPQNLGGSFVSGPNPTLPPIVLNPGRNVQGGGGNMFNPFTALTPGRNVTGGYQGTVPFGAVTPGRNVTGGVQQYQPPVTKPPAPTGPQGAYVGQGVYLQPAQSPQAPAFGPGPSSYNAYSESLLTRLAQGEDPANFSKAEQDTMERLLAGQGQGQPPNPNQPYGGYTNTGGGQYADTASAQYYAAAGTPFAQQITYINGKKMKIGDAIRRGLLDVKTGRRSNTPMKRNRKGNLVPIERGGGATSQAAAPAGPQGPMPSFGVVNMNFSTATG